MQASPKTLDDLVSDIWRARAYILGGIFAGLAVAAALLFMAIPCYRGELIVEPAKPLRIEDAPQIAASEGGVVQTHFLIEQAGAADQGDFTRFESIYDGPAVAEILLKDDKIVQGLSYDRAAAIFPDTEQWTPQSLAEYLHQRVREEAVGATALRRLIYLHPSPAFAAYFLQKIYNAADGLIREQEKNAAQKRIAYLENALASAENPDNRRAIASLLTEQERVLMLAAAEQPYAATIVEPANASARPKWPDKAMTALVFAAIGAAGGFLLHAARRA